MTIKKKDNFTTFAKAIAKYIKSIGGSALVVGGVKIGQEFGALKYNYYIQIGITGKPPKSKIKLIK